jgi:hypothetical protein
VVRDVVAFANSNGGTVYIGVNVGRRGALAGVDKPDETIAELKTAVERTITPPLPVTIDVLKSQSKNVVRVVVPRGDDPPYVLEGSKIYVRQESVTNLAMRDEIVGLISRAATRGAAQPARSAAQPAPAPVEEQPKPQRQSRRGRAPLPAPAEQPAPETQPAAPPERPQPQQQQSRRSSPRVSRESAPERLPERAPQRAPQGAPQGAREGARDGAPEQSQRRAPAPPVSAPVTASSAPVSGGGHEPPRTGVEIVDSAEREGVSYHSMRDLRNGQVAQNVSRTSARFLWRYAIALKEKGTFQVEKVKWSGDIGLWHKYFRSGQPHYDLAQKDADGNVHVYYGVTEDGIHGDWKAVVGMEE